MENKVVRFLVNAGKSILLPVLVYVVFAILTKGRIVNTRTLMVILRQSVIPTIICWALVLNITLGVWNFAAGGIVLCALIIGGNFSNMLGMGLPGIILFCIIFSLFLSFVVGILFNIMHVPAIVLTLGMVLIFESIPRIFFQAGVIVPRRDTFLAREPWCFVVLILVFCVFYVIYNKTAFGHNLRALGSNAQIAGTAGLNVNKVTRNCFLMSGFFLGVAAVIYGSANGEVRNVTAMGSMTIMMDAFMGVFLAFFLAQYCDLTVAVFLGTFTMRLLVNGFVAMGTSATVRDMANGFFLFILLAISANQGLFERMRTRREQIQIANEKYALKLKAQN
jgi:ribose/xylose/arabinose/galactoside ABC-type transport system permease subunit